MNNLPPAMVLAAGLGTRLRPLTDTCPKPLIDLGNGQHALGRIVRALHAAGCPRMVVNTHYLAPMVEAEIAKLKQELGADIRISHEPAELLETGGGLKKAAPLLQVAENEPVLVVNSDAVWSEATAPLFAPLWQLWLNKPSNTKALLAVKAWDEVREAFGHADFWPEGPENTLRRAEKAENVGGVVYAGVQILELKHVLEHNQTRFSLNVVWDKLLKEKKLSGWTYGGPWAEIGSMAGLEAAKQLIVRHG